MLSVHGLLDVTEEIGADLMEMAANNVTRLI
jgi:hypothetical protein